MPTLIETMLLKQQQSQLEPETPEVTIKLAGKEVTLAQKPHIEADIKAARSVLSKLLDSAPASAPTATLVSRVVESDG